MPMQVMTELLDQLRAPALPVTLREISQVILPVSGTLLGLVYAGLIYWFQGALERLTYASELLEDVVSINGKIVLDLLVGASLVSLFGLFGLTNIASVAFWVFAIFIITDVARVTAEYGELETISTSKFIPEAYGSTRRFLRKIRNAGPIHWFGGLILLGITTGYPIWISSAGGFSWRMQTNSLIVFLLVTLAFGLVRVRSLLLEALETRNTLKERLATSDEQAARRLEDPEVEWDGVKKRIERKILEERLKALGVRQPFEHPELKDQADCQMHDLERTPALNRDPARPAS